MINFIIYEDDQKVRDKYISVIIKLMGNREDQYKIIELREYNPMVNKVLSLPGKKIFILDVEVPGKSGLDLAREIRGNGDWESQIIIVTNHDGLQQKVFTSRLLTLDFISKFDNSFSNLREALVISYTIVTQSKALKIQYDGEFQQFYYNDILYIKKDHDDIDPKVILSDGSSKYIRMNMKDVEKKLKKDPRFYRTHRGCIVNIFKIKSVDFSEGIINFGNQKIGLLSRDKKQEFKKILNETLHDNNKNKIIIKNR